MKIFLGIFLSVFMQNSDCSEIQKVREKYHQIKNSDQLDSFIAYLEKLNCEMAQPYLASSIMQKAEYSFSPIKKLKYFNSGKTLLEDYIKNNPKNIEAKYVRVMVQSEIPSFLGYHKEMEADLQFIKKNTSTSDLSKEYQEIILKNINAILK